MGWLPGFGCRGVIPVLGNFPLVERASLLVRSGWLRVCYKKKKVNNCNVEGGKEEANLRLSFILFLAGKNTDNFRADGVKSLFSGREKGERLKGLFFHIFNADGDLRTSRGGDFIERPSEKKDGRPSCAIAYRSERITLT